MDYADCSADTDVFTLKVRSFKLEDMLYHLSRLKKVISDHSKVELSLLGVEKVGKQKLP